MMFNFPVLVKTAFPAILMLVLSACSSVDSTATSLRIGSLPVPEVNPDRDGAGRIIIRSNAGGSVSAFLLERRRYERDGTNVHFVGQCDSACTLFLGLPSDQICVARGAVFRFHKPSAGSARDEAVALRYMMSNYPGWVRNWISRKGGLRKDFISMPASYAQNYLPTCSVGRKAA